MIDLIAPCYFFFPESSTVVTVIWFDTRCGQLGPFYALEGCTVPRGRA